MVPSADRGLEVCTAGKYEHRTTPKSQVYETQSIGLQNFNKGFLGNIHLPNRLHPLLAFFLLLEELAFAGDVASVALGGHVFAHGTDALTSHNLAADGGLDGDLLHLNGNDILELCSQ